MRLTWVLLLLAALASTGTAAADPALAELQRPGQQLFVQSCGICHLKPTLTSERYGPALSRETVEGKEEAVGELIRTGTARMPGFRYGLAPAQIDAIIAYLKTLPTPAAAQPSRPDASPKSTIASGRRLRMRARRRRPAAPYSTGSTCPPSARATSPLGFRRSRPHG